MLRRFSLDFAIFSISLDALLVGMALRLAVLLRPALSTLPFARHVPPEMGVPGVLYLLLPLLWVLVLLSNSQYDGRRNLRIWKEISTLSYGSLVALAVMAGVLYLTYRDVSRLLFLAFVLLAYGMMSFWRLAYRGAYHLGLLRSVDPRNVLIAGAGVLGQEVHNQVLSYHVLGLRPVGFLDDDPTRQAEGVQILGQLADARQVVIEQEVDDVIIALPPQAYQAVFQLVTELHTLAVKVWMIPDFFKLALNKTVVEEFAGLPMLDLRAPALSETQRLVKRTFDLVFVLLAMPILLPLMGVIALAIRLEGPGEVLFRQPRVGENGRIFKMLKFRTMVPNAESMRSMVESVDEQGHLIHKRADDPRVTRIGRWLRQSSLDELPQAFNILLGDMSLVGPRPELPYLVEKYQPWQRRRFAVPQGLTGWWQVNGRSDRPMHLNTEDDLYYVQNYSVFLDLLILMKTVGVVLRGKGAF